jgi:hypothetical protein
MNTLKPHEHDVTATVPQRPQATYRNRPEPLAQVDLLLLFSPALQNHGGGKVKDMPADAKQAWVTCEVFGTIGHSEIDGHPVLEDMRVERDGEDITDWLETGTVNAIADYVL